MLLCDTRVASEYRSEFEKIVFQHKPANSCRESLIAYFLIVNSRDHTDIRFWKFGDYLADRRNAIHPRHLMVHQYPIRLVLPIQLKCLLAVRTFIDLVGRVRKIVTKEKSYFFVIVDYQDFHLEMPICQRS